QSAPQSGTRPGAAATGFGERPASDQRHLDRTQDSAPVAAVDLTGRGGIERLQPAIEHLAPSRLLLALQPTTQWRGLARRLQTVHERLQVVRAASRHDRSPSSTDYCLHGLLGLVTVARNAVELVGIGHVDQVM